MSKLYIVTNSISQLGKETIRMWTQKCRRLPSRIMFFNTRFTKSFPSVPTINQTEFEAEWKMIYMMSNSCYFTRSRKVFVFSVRNYSFRNAHVCDAMSNGWLCQTDNSMSNRIWCVLILFHKFRMGCSLADREKLKQLTKSMNLYEHWVVGCERVRLSFLTLFISKLVESPGHWPILFCDRF